MRIMGLDYGDKTIGVAVSDPLLITAGGLEIIRRSDEKSLKKSIARLSELTDEYEVHSIVLGYPKNMDNTEDNERCAKTLVFRDRLLRNFKRIPIVLWDERLSTRAADYVLSELSHIKRKNVVDKLAAVYILQGYLDYLSHSTGGNE